MSAFLAVANVPTVTTMRYSAVVNAMEAFVVVLLICLLVAQLLLRAYGGTPARRADRLDVAIWPLVLIMLIVVALRTAPLLPGG